MTSIKQLGRVVTAAARRDGTQSAIGAPIIVAGRLWGVMALGSPREAGLASGLEERLAAFAELAATAIANAEAREELRRVAGEQAALRRVATLVARASPRQTLFSAITEEVGRLLSVDVAILARFGAGTETPVAAWSKTGTVGELGKPTRIGGDNVATLVFTTGRPARIDDQVEVTGEVAAAAREWGLRSRVGVAVPSQLGELSTELGQVAAGLTARSMSCASTSAGSTPRCWPSLVSSRR
jgi:GAF domain-containing protein